MRKGKIIRLITAVSLSISLLAAGGIYASAQIYPTTENPNNSAIDTLKGHGFTQVYTTLPSNIKNCVIGYGTPNCLSHFAKMENGIVSAKMGGNESVYHSSYNTYMDCTAYSTPVAFFVNPHKP